MKSSVKISITAFLVLIIAGCSGGGRLYQEETVIIVIEEPIPEPVPEPPLIIIVPETPKEKKVIKYRDSKEDVRPRQNENKTRESTGERTLNKGRTR